MKNIDEKKFLTSNIYFYDNIKKIEDHVSNLVLGQKKEADGVCVRLNLDKYDESAKASVLALLNKFIKSGYVPELWVESHNLQFSVSDLETMIDVEESLKSFGAELNIVENDNLFSLDETLSAFDKANKFIEFVKSTNTSPLEKYLMIYGYISSFVYKENKDDALSSRQLISVLNSDDIVCVGYARLLEFMCNAVGINCVSQTIEINNKDTGETSYHQTNTVLINDDKYNVHGVFYADSCWDSINEGKEPYLNYNYALVPISDLKNMVEDIKVYNRTKNLFYEVENFDDFMFDYFAYFGSNENPDLELSQKLGYKESLDKFDISDADLKNASAILLNFLDEHNISNDAYLSLNGAPLSLDVNFLLSLCIYSPVLDVFIHHYLDKMTACLAGENTEGRNIWFKTLSGVRNLKNLREDLNWYFHPEEYEFDHDQSAAFFLNDKQIKNYARNIKYYLEYRNYLKEINEKNKDVSIENFRGALKNSFIAGGMSELEAKKMSDRAIDKSTKRSEKCFSGFATNCFRKEMLNIRESKKD